MDLGGIQARISARSPKARFAPSPAQSKPQQPGICTECSESLSIAYLARRQQNTWQNIQLERQLKVEICSEAGEEP
jgi:hypothetical protein